MQLRDGTEVNDRRLDRLAEFDEASRDYPVCGVITVEQPTTTLWTIPAGEPVLDQGPDGACVGFGVTNELRFHPVPISGLDALFAKRNIYWAAQRIDNWPGGSYPGARPVYEGTSVLAGVKAAAKLGFYGEYRWAFSEPELALGVSQIGPAIIGIPWFTGMFRPTRAGYLNPTGKAEGGHCVLVIGIDVDGGYYTIYNSWGPSWGNKGTAKLRRRDMASLLNQRGDACVITQRTAPQPAAR